MSAYVICSECKGKGEYQVYNAYDPDFEQMIDCEYCLGEGVVPTKEEVDEHKHVWN